MLVVRKDYTMRHYAEITVLFSYVLSVCFRNEIFSVFLSHL